MNMSTILLCISSQYYQNLRSLITPRLPGLRILEIRNHEELTAEFLAQQNPERIYFPHWSQIIPPHIFDHYECIAFHMTDLPYGRGGSPLQNLIKSGHSSTNISALRMTQEVDAGPIYHKQPLDLSGSAHEIFSRCEPIVADMICHIETTRPVPQPQLGEPSFFKRRKPEQGNLSECQSAREAYDHIRMLDALGYPHAFLQTESLLFDFSQATLQDDEVLATVKIRKRLS